MALHWHLSTKSNVRCYYMREFDEFVYALDASGMSNRYTDPSEPTVSW